LWHKRHRSAAVKGAPGAPLAPLVQLDIHTIQTSKQTKQAHCLIYTLFQTSKYTKQAHNLLDADVGGVVFGDVEAGEGARVHGVQRAVLDHQTI